MINIGSIDEKKAKLGRDSNELLNNYLIKSFFEQKEKDLFDMFSNLPFNANIEDFRCVLHALKAIHELKEMLEIHVKSYKETQMKFYQESRYKLNNNI